MTNHDRGLVGTSSTPVRARAGMLTAIVVAVLVALGAWRFWPGAEGPVRVGGAVGEAWRDAPRSA